MSACLPGHDLRSLMLWQPDQSANLSFLEQQVGQANALEHIVNLLLQHLPHRANAARQRSRAPLFTHGMRNAIEVERGYFGSRDDGPDRNLLRLARERIATVRAPRTADDVGTTKSQQDLFDVVDGQPLVRGNLAASDWPFRDASREMERADDAVLGQRGDTHSWRL